MEKDDNHNNNEGDKEPATKKTKNNDNSPPQNLTLLPESSSTQLNNANSPVDEGDRKPPTSIFQKFTVLPLRNADDYIPCWCIEQGGHRRYNHELETIHITLIQSSKRDVSGFGVYFIPKYKDRDIGPRSTIIMHELVHKGLEIAEGIFFEKTKYPFHFPTGQIQRYHDYKNKQQFQASVFVCYMETQSHDEGYFRKLAQSIADKIAQKQVVDGCGTGISCEVPDDFLDKKRKVWSNVVGSETACVILMEKFHLKMKWYASSVQPSEEWKKERLELMAAYFKKGTVPHNFCLDIGLPVEWDVRLTPRGRNLDILDDVST